MRPLLRPGTHVLRRGENEVQVGLDPEHALVLPGTADVRATLALLSRAADRSEHPHPATLDLLESHGLLVDQAAALPLLPGSGEPSDSTPRTVSPRHDVAALVRSSGDEAPARVRARRKLAVLGACFGGAAGTMLLTRMLALLGDVGVAARRRTGATGATEVGLLVGCGEPDRELVDGWMRESVPHLLVRVSEGHASVGPFVVPGRTACLRCLDAHAADADPSWPLLVAQYAACCERARPDGLPEPVDLLLATVAVAWAARDVVSFGEGRRPSTWSTTVRLDPTLSSIESRAWLRHPECGCGWQ
ncbi:MAG TPA: hypothetical protein VF049_08305 [Nocardioidaceae bacterium]|jgi:bacteriocin biosynthesis cyclodehydratase domain-containing protein